MQNILASELREQAGSNSFNRFDYQAHWIVYHMIIEFKKKSQFLVFCEFHDDMTKVSDIQNPNCAEFFQIKTTAKYNKWTLPHLTKTTTKSSGVVKNSFLGFLFYNFMKFEAECSKCHFVSNIGMDAEIRKWQSIIEDGKQLKTTDNALYSKIKNLIRNEFNNINPNEFDGVFDKFVQETYIYDGDLPLENYEKVVAGEFFRMLENDEFYTSNSNKILKDIIEDVRKKSKTKIEVPISYNKLVEKKGISSEVFSALQSSVKKISSQSYFKELEEFLTDNGLSLPKRRLLLRELKEHKLRMLDINKLLYQDITYQIVGVIDEVLTKYYSRIDDTSYLLDKIRKQCETIIKDNTDFNIPIVEAIFYERLVSENTTI
ncbi:dsDNA nuclease domain-containing protein [Paenibacillus xerothermodurans]|uniref:dsDNA nuclease domain-containing protein n=1 Tax=Paenibacillus xerothermodurans TaxID=1977292 RepID=UPI0014028734|nr:dsDNA nuclease domain-containing protein [Paenibacillus xerothermodurans]